VRSLLYVLGTIGIIWAMFILVLGSWVWATWMMKFLNYAANKKCWLRHDWQHHQYSFAADSRGNGVIYTDIVIAFKVCKRCANSKLVHILR
jgi:hypothetical protein